MSVIAPPPKRGPNKNTVLIVVASIVAIALVAVLLASLADSGDKKQAGTKKPTTTVPGTPAPKALTLQLGELKVQNTGLPTKVKPSIRRVLLNVTQGYVDNAILAPLASGKVNAAYTVAFDPGVKPAAKRKDRAVLTEASSGAATGPVKATATHVRIDALGDPTGKIAFAATTFTLRIKAPTAKGMVNIRRRTELTFANEFGKWVVTAYRVSVRRTLGAKATTSSASSAIPMGTTA